MDTPVSIFDLKEYLDERRRDLALLELDLRCPPFGLGLNRLVLAVDWSEVFAYIFADRPRGDELLSRVIDKDIVDASHLAALTFVFERFPGDVILIPPYVDEMSDFVRLAHSHALDDTLIRLDDARKRRRIASEHRVAEVIRRLKALQDRVGGGGATDLAEQFLETLKGEDRATLLGWIEESFGSLLLIARLSSVDGLRALSGLLRADEPRLKTLANNRADLARWLSRRPISLKKWERELALLQPAPELGRRQGPTALKRDAQALAYLERLIPLMHARNEQLIFITRSSHLAEVMRKFPGRFAALGDDYMKFPSSPAIPSPTICRNWRVLFEMAMVWDHQPGDSNAQISADVSKTLEQRSLALDALRTTLNGRDADRAAKALAKSLREDVEHNRQVYVSTIRPNLMQMRKKADPTRLAVGLFVDYVTDPAWQDRSRISQELLETVNLIVDNLKRYDGGTITDPWEAEGAVCRSVTRVFVRSAEPTTLTDDVTDSEMRETLNRMFEDIQRDGPTAPDSVADTLRRLNPDPTSHSDRDVQAARLLVTSLFRVGAVERLGLYESRYESLLKRMPVLSAGWTLDRLMISDFRSWRANPARANVWMRDSWDEIKNAGQAGANGRTYALRTTGFLNAWLRLHLDWIELHDEWINDFPIINEGGKQRFELEYILDEVRECIQRWPIDFRGERLATPVARSIFANAVYAAGRLAPFIEHQYGVGARGLQLADTRSMTALLDKYLNAQFIADAAAALEVVLDKSVEEIVSIAYLRIKIGYWSGAGSVAGRENLQNADLYLDQASRLLRDSDHRRLSNLVAKHQLLLAETKATVDFAPRPV
ncbi:MAG: hypothetical protein M3O30_17900 [Planctomycetota bacterium]|nr:hypothetical protein [Planctomycetota bacterium]